MTAYRLSIRSRKCFDLKDLIEMMLSQRLGFRLYVSFLGGIYVSHSVKMIYFYFGKEA